MDSMPTSNSMTWNVGDIMRKRALISPNKTAIIYEDRAISYLALNTRVNRVAHALQAMGVKKGDCVASLFFNCPEFIEVYFASAKLGAIYVPLNFRLVAPEIKYQLDNSGASVLFFHRHFLDEINKIHDDISIESGHYVLLDDEDTKPEKSSQWPIKYQTLLAAQTTNEPEPDKPILLDDPLAIIHTSGVTGNPKGAVVSHLQTYFKCMQVMMYTDMRSDDIFLAQIPLFHSAGLSVVTTPVLFRGGTFLLRKQFDPHHFANDIARYRPTIILALTTMWRFVLDTGKLDGLDLSSVRSVLGGGERTPTSMMDDLARHGIHLQQIFGQTENSAMMVLPLESITEKQGSVGIPGMCNDVWIADEAGNPVPAGVSGRILAKGPTVMSGYWNMPEKTAEALDPTGVLDTGDIGYMDEDGFCYIVDRAKDMYRSGGENVYPAEVEKVLIGHPLISNAAVIGTPDDKWGETGKAFIVLTDSSTLTLEAVHDFLEGQIARYKFPRQLQILDELPITASGKVQKSALK